MIRRPRCSRLLVYLLQAPLLLLLTLPALGAGRVDCGAVKSTYARANVPYCALLPPSYDRQPNKRFPVLYLLHGLGDNHQSIINNGIWNLIEGLQEEKKIGEFVIITPNAGRTFYVNAKNGRVRYEDFLVREFLPAMESRFRVGRTRSTRAISGISMGGYGALRLAFKHPRLFNAVSAHSPALIQEMPRGAESAGLGMFMGTSFGDPFDPAYWKNNTPFAFARYADLKGLRIYFDCGDRDEYGFDAGTRALDKLLSARGIPHEAHIYPGGHDPVYFATHFPASMEFHSRAFGLTK
jgi:S-formylglutathione hydrolase FrmB